MKINTTQNSMIFGEISPTLHGQRDLEQYKRGLKRLSNFLIRPQGGILRRSGFAWQMDLPRVPAEIPADHRYRVIPYTFTDYLGKARVVVLIIQHGFMTAWEEDASGKFGPVSFGRTDLNTASGVHPTQDPYWVNCSYPQGWWLQADGASPGNAGGFTGSRILNLGAGQGPILLGYPDTGLDGQSTWKLGTIDTVPFGHGSGPYRVANATDLGLTDVEFGPSTGNHMLDADDLLLGPKSLAATPEYSSGPYWLVVQSTDKASTGLVPITDTESPVYLGLSSQPIFPTQTAHYPSGIDSGITNSVVNITNGFPGGVVSNAVSRFGLIPWHCEGNADYPTPVVQEGQWFKDFRRRVDQKDENDAVVGVLHDEPDYCDAAYGSDIQYIQDNNTLWISLSSNVVAKIEYRSCNTPYGANNGPQIQQDSGLRVQHDLVLNLYPLGVAGPFRSEHDGTGLTITGAATNDPRGSAIAITRDWSAPGPDPNSNEKRTPVHITTSTISNVVLGPAVLGNLLRCSYSLGDDPSTSLQLEGPGPNKTAYPTAYPGGNFSPTDWFPNKNLPQNKSYKHYEAYDGKDWWKNTVTYEDVVGFKVLLGRSLNQTPHPAFAEFINSFNHLGQGFGQEFLRSRHWDADYTSPGAPVALALDPTNIYYQQVQSTHWQECHRWYTHLEDPNRSLQARTGAGIAGPLNTTGYTVPIQMTVCLQMGETDSGQTAMAGIPAPNGTWKAGVMPTDNPNYFGAASGKSWERASLGAPQSVGGYWVDVGTISVKAALSNYRTNKGFPTANTLSTGSIHGYTDPWQAGWDSWFNLGVQKQENGHGFGYTYNELKDFDFAVADAFRDPISGISALQDIPTGTEFYLAWRVGGGGVPPEPYHADGESHYTNVQKIARVGSDPGAQDGPWPGATQAVIGASDQALYPANVVMPTFSRVENDPSAAFPADWITSPGYLNSSPVGGVRYQADPHYWGTYTDASAMPYIKTRSVSTDEKQGGYSMVSINSVTPEPQASESARFTDYIHAMWDDTNPYSSSIYEIVRQSDSNFASTPGLTAWNANYGKGLDKFAHLSMTRFQERLVIAGGIDDTMLSLSATNSLAEPRFVPFDYRGSTSTSAVSFNARIDRLEGAITNVFSIENDLFVATANRIWKVFSSTESAPIAWDTIFQQPLSDQGASYIQAALSEDTAVYASANTQYLNRIVFGGDDEGYRLDEISIYSRHLIQSGMRRIVSQKTPQNIIWAVDSKGQLASWTTHRRELIMGASSHQLGGALSAVPKVDDIAFFEHPNQPGEGKVIGLIRRERSSGEQIFSVEILSQDFRPNAPTSEWRYLDRYVEYELSEESIAVPSHTLDAFAGETATVIFDEVEYQNVMIDTLGGIADPPWDTPGTNIVVGFPYSSVMETLPIDISMSSRSSGSGGGETDLSLRRVYEVALKLNNSKGGYVRDTTAVDTSGELMKLEYPHEQNSGREVNVKAPIDMDDNTNGSIRVETNSNERMEITQIVLRSDYKQHGSD